ncbi:hypothetical protein EDB84DRAFT_1676511, partial [Lactarius hengduanensis]
MAASNIAKLFKAFPDLDEDAIKLMRIRIEGYSTRLSFGCQRSQPRLLERNVDVLVQLLQSVGEPRLYVVVGGFPHSLQTNRRKSLWSNMALQTTPQADSEVTLGVLCDQIEPSDDSMEDEDKTIRERLRALVGRVPRQDAQKHILAQLQGRIKILRGRRGEDILLFLPAFNDGRRGAGTSLHLLLARAASALREDLAPGRNPASLEEQYPPFSLPHPPSRPAPPSSTW